MRHEAPKPLFSATLGFVYDARWPQTANQLLTAGYRWDQALSALGLIDDQGRLLPRDDDQHPAHS